MRWADLPHCMYAYTSVTCYTYVKKHKYNTHTDYFGSVFVGRIYRAIGQIPTLTHKNKYLVL